MQRKQFKLYFRGTPRPEVFPFTEGNSSAIRQLNQPKFSSNRFFDKTGISPTVRTMQGGNLQPKIAVRETEDGFHSYRNDQKKSSIQGTHVTVAEGKTNCLNTVHVPMTIENTRIRKLTPMECERLQGFPDGWTKWGREHSAEQEKKITLPREVT